ncbi:tRNA-binding protein [Candidatus Caldipriscus sp.]|jgi:tRNA-binding protein|nr:tRNA-binding protein [Candidatus Caldipriscus sp.]
MIKGLEMRVGKIVEAKPHPKARKPAYVLKIDFGPYGIKTSSAQITDLYKVEDLIGRLVICATNLEPKNIAGVISEVLVLGVPDEEGRVVLIGPDRDVPLGGEVF